MTPIRPAIEYALIDLMPKLPELFTEEDAFDEWPVMQQRRLRIKTALRYAVLHGWAAVGNALDSGRTIYRKLPPKEFEFERTPQHQAWDKWKLENGLK